MSTTAHEHLTKLKAKRKTHLEVPRERSTDPLKGYCGAPGGTGASEMVDEPASFIGMDPKKQCQVCAAAYRRQRDAQAAERIAESEAQSDMRTRMVVAARFGTTREEMAQSLAKALIRATRGRASVPHLPRKLDPYVWSRTCKGAAFGRCRNCQLCEDDTMTDTVNEIEQTHAPAESRPAKPAKKWLWATVDAAIWASVSAYADSPSPSGMMLEKARLGLLNVQLGGKGEDQNMLEAEDTALASKLLSRVYSDDGEHKLTAVQCRDVLVYVTKATTSFGEIAGLTQDQACQHAAEHYSVYTGDVKAIVKWGRQALIETLLDKGLLKPPEARTREAHRGQVEAQERASVWRDLEFLQEAA